jgi:hypothetical protein
MESGAMNTVQLVGRIGSVFKRTHSAAAAARWSD